jgi:hypothetical protein
MIDWNPSNKSYEWTGNSLLVNTKFLDNGLFVDYLPTTEDVSVGHWNTIEERNNLFIVFDKLYIDAITVDSLIKTTAYLSLHNEEKYNYTFKQQNLEIPKKLLGDWVLVAFDTLGTEHFPLFNRFEFSTFDFLSIRKDSIRSIKNNVETTKKWTIGGTNNLIIFPDVVLEKDTIPKNILTKKERIVLINILKIDSISENELILLAENGLYSFDGFERKLTFRREKTKANKELR